MIAQSARLIIVLGLPYVVSIVSGDGFEASQSVRDDGNVINLSVCAFPNDAAVV